MLEKSLLKSEVEAALNSWMKHKPVAVHIEIFAKNSGNDCDNPFSYLSNGVRVVHLPTVEDCGSTNPGSSFSVIKYFHNNHIDK